MNIGPLQGILRWFRGNTGVITFMGGVVAKVALTFTAGLKNIARLIIHPTSSAEDVRQLRGGQLARSRRKFSKLNAQGASRHGSLLRKVYGAVSVAATPATAARTESKHPAAPYGPDPATDGGTLLGR
jgi:hypothetical protein